MNLQMPVEMVTAVTVHLRLHMPSKIPEMLILQFRLADQWVPPCEPKTHRTFPNIATLKVFLPLTHDGPLSLKVGLYPQPILNGLKALPDQTVGLMVPVCPLQPQSFAGTLPSGNGKQTMGQTNRFHPVGGPSAECRGCH